MLTIVVVAALCAILLVVLVRLPHRVPGIDIGPGGAAQQLAGP